MMRLKEKTAIVTGAGGGIGGAICRRFAEEGAAVICVDIHSETAAGTAEAIQQAGGKAVALAADVADEQTAIDAVAMAGREFGGLDILVSNAIHDLAYVPVTEISLADWQRSVDVNLTSAFLLCKHAVPALARRGGGSIILVASQLGQVAKPGRAWYCAQKGALINMAKAIALDHAAQNIRVNSLSPGPVGTERFYSQWPSRAEAEAGNGTMFDRLGTPEEIAAGAAFLASNDSSFMTGSDLLLDGGYTAV